MFTRICIYLILANICFSPSICFRKLYSSLYDFRKESVEFQLVDKINSLCELMHYIRFTYLTPCNIAVLYDKNTQFTELFLSSFLRDWFPHTQSELSRSVLLNNGAHAYPCQNYILLLKDIRNFGVIGSQLSSRAVIYMLEHYTQSNVSDFLASEEAATIVNLLLIVSSKNSHIYKTTEFVLYTHNLYSDANGSSTPNLLTTWRSNHLSRPINLFPKKMSRGFSGSNFVIASAEQLPFVISKLRGNKTWDGLEARLFQLLSETFNYTIQVRDLNEDIEMMTCPKKAIVNELLDGNSDIGIGGLYVTPDTIGKIAMSTCHSQDCAVFITKSLLALPRYRAIMGPFHWSVWLALLFTYLLAIFPLSFSHRHSIRHLWKKPLELENMFWYVFGTFTNLFTFRNKTSWTSASKNATKVFIGVYWMFSIIISACYTGSIIAFVTLPVYPQVVETCKQLLDFDYKIATLDCGEWQKIFSDSSDPVAYKLIERIEVVSNVTEGLRYVKMKGRFPYAFLGSWSWLDYILQANYTHSNEDKRSVLHISSECFVPFCVAIGFPKNAIYREVMNEHIQYAIQTGFVSKIKRQVEWEVQRSDKGRLLQVSVGRKLLTKSLDKILSLDDIQGIFLLLGAGFAIAFFALFVELCNWVYLRCTKRI